VKKAEADAIAKASEKTFFDTVAQYFEEVSCGCSINDACSDEMMLTTGRFVVMVMFITLRCHACSTQWPLLSRPL